MCFIHCASLPLPILSHGSAHADVEHSSWVWRSENRSSPCTHILYGELGVPRHEILRVSSLMGTKFVINEFVAYRGICSHIWTLGAKMLNEFQHNRLKEHNGKRRSPLGSSKGYCRICSMWVRKFRYVCKIEDHWLYNSRNRILRNPDRCTICAGTLKRENHI
jgi:hypothetical protein